MAVSQSEAIIEDQSGPIRGQYYLAAMIPEAGRAETGSGQSLRRSGALRGCSLEAACC